MPKIAISYRRSDSEAMTGRIFDRLIARYGKDAIFRDIDDIPVGIDFRQHINETLLKTDILLAIIGPEWLGQRGKRIQEEADPVRVEVETAMRRKVPTIPVLIGSTKMPTAEQLPPGLKDFAFRNAVKVDTGLDFDYHMDRLIRAMDVILEKKSPPSGETRVPQLPPTKEPPAEKLAASSPSSKSHNLPQSLVGALSLDGRAKDDRAKDARAKDARAKEERGKYDRVKDDRATAKPAAAPGAAAGYLALLWPQSRNGRIVRAAGALAVLVLIGVVVFGSGQVVERNRPLLTLNGHTAAITSVAYSPNAKMIASGSSDRTVKVWDAVGGQLLRTFPGDYGPVSAVAFLPDGHRVASASLNGAIIIWNADSGQLIRSLKSDANYSWISSPAVRSIAVSPDGARVASGAANSTITIWNDGNGGVLQVIHSDDQDIESVAFAPDGRMLLAGAKDGTIRLWDTLAGQLVRTLTGHRGQILAVAVSADGRRLAAAGGGNAVMVWNAANGDLLNTLTSGSSVVSAIAFAPDNRRLAVGGNDSRVELMDTDSGQVLRSLSGHSGPVRTLAFSADGSRLVSGSDDNTIDVWAN